MPRKKRKDGRYSASVELGEVNGKRRRKYLYADTQKELNEKVAALKAEQGQGRDVGAKAQTVGQFFAHWLATVVAQRNRPRTIASYTAMVRLHIAPALGAHALDKLTPQHVQGMLTALLAAGLSARTVQYARSIVRRALGQALKWGLVARNVAALTDAPRVERAPLQPLSAAQARALLATVGAHRLGALYATALTLGLRQGELIALRWADLDFDKATLRVGVSKTVAGVRTLAIPRALLATLQQHQQAQQAEQARRGAAWHDHGLVFPSDRGTPLGARNLLRHYKAALKRAALPPITFHLLRHTCASLLVADGVHPRVVQEILGHSSFTVTMDTYSHVSSATQREALEGLAEGLQGDGGDAVVSPVVGEQKTPQD